MTSGGLFIRGNTRFSRLVRLWVNIYLNTNINIYHLFPKSIEEAIMPSLQRALRISSRWILCHRHRHKQLGVENPGMLNEELSRNSDWRNGNKAFKDVWGVKAKKLKLEHAQDHLDYKYNPRKPEQKKRTVHGAAKAPYPLEGTVDHLDIEKYVDRSNVQYAISPGYHYVSCLKSMTDRHNDQAALEPSTTLPSIKITPLEISSLNRHALNNEMLMGLVGNNNGIIDFNNDVAFAQIRCATNLLIEEIAALTNAASLDRSVESDFDRFFNFFNDN
ncbi:hypothetical protein V2W45_1470223 [Cenococcum geophilum]